VIIPGAAEKIEMAGGAEGVVLPPPPPPWEIQTIARAAMAIFETNPGKEAETLIVFPYQSIVQGD
jgi:hypothetical protein